MRHYDLRPTQHLSTLVVAFATCSQCGFVARTNAKTPWLCERCDHPNELPAGHFPLSVAALVDLIHTQRWRRLPADAVEPPWAPPAAEVSTVILLCTLHETLLAHLLKGQMKRLAFNQEQQVEMLGSFRGLSQRTKMFHALTGLRLPELAREFSCKEAWDLAGRASRLRNKFVHTGKAWDEVLAPECVECLGDLLRLYALSHNRLLEVR